MPPLSTSPDPGAAPDEEPVDELHLSQTFDGRYQLDGSFSADTGLLVYAALDAQVDRHLRAARDGDPSVGLVASQVRAAALVDLAAQIAATTPEAGLTDLVTELEGRAAAQHAPAVPGVTLASMHSAKGLEWDAVFCVGLVDGVLPIAHAKREEEIEEERRLLYVAVTRARQRLALSWHRSRQVGGAGNRRRSRFLTTLDGAHDLGDHRRRKSASKQRRADLQPGDAEVFERLRTWRADQAKAGSIPAYVVFSDATLVAIAESRPRTQAQLRMVSGVGPTKWERYGPAVLAVVSGASTDFQTAVESSR